MVIKTLATALLVAILAIGVSSAAFAAEEEKKPELLTGASATMLANTCAGCHANDYESGEGPHSNLSNDRNCGASGCHRVSDRDWD